MDSDLTLDFIIIIVLIIANGLFSMTELAIVNAKKRKLEELAESGNERAKTAFELSENPNEMFSTIQIGITLVGILTGLYSGATFSSPLEEILVSNIPSIEPYAASVSSFIIVAIITYLSLVIGELVPKRLALNSPESIAVVVAKPIYWLSVALKPIVSFLGISTEFLLKILGVTVKEEAPVTESESDIMTPRTQLKWIDLNGTEDEIMEVLKNANHYRIPVGTDSLDELKGLVTVSDVLVQIMQRPSESSIHDIIKACLKEPVLVPESISLMKLLNVLRTEGVHEAIILDEYGGFTGLVTLHDIMEEIVGLMPSGEEEIKEEENKIIERDGAWLVDGLLNVDEFKEFFHIDQELPGEEDDLYKTMGGLLNVLFGRIPKELDKAKWNGYTFEVIDMDHTRIDKILVTYEEPIVEQEEEK